MFDSPKIPCAIGTERVLLRRWDPRHRQQDADGLYQDLRMWSLLRQEYAASAIKDDLVSAWNECGEKIL